MTFAVVARREFLTLPNRKASGECLAGRVSCMKNPDCYNQPGFLILWDRSGEAIRWQLPAFPKYGRTRKPESNQPMGNLNGRLAAEQSW